MLEHLDKEKYEPRDIFIDRGGAWHLHGVPVLPERALRGVDVAFNAMHGEFGEDGGVQRMLDTLAIPYTGSGASASTLAFNKQHTREAVQKLGVHIPHGVTVGPATPTASLEEKAMYIFRTFPHPVIVKPITGGSSVGTTVAGNFEALLWGLQKALEISQRALVEEYIQGKESTVGVIEQFRNEDAYALMPIEIIPPKGSNFFDYDAKYSGKSIERSPGNFTREEKTKLMDTARAVHQGLGLSHYSRSDFIVSKRGIYFLEVNTLPGMTGESLLPKALHAVGSKLSDFLDHVIHLARHEGTR